MKIIKRVFESKNEQEEFWKKAQYDIADIGVYLNDINLFKESLYFSLHFAEPEVLNFYSLHELDFKGIKKFLEIPSVYIDRDFDIYSSNALKVEVPRNKLLLDTTNVKTVKKKFISMIKQLTKETEEASLSLKKNIDLIIDEGLIKKEDLNLSTINFNLIKKLEKFIKEKK